ncbi:MAG: hypothetical protein AAF488_14470 [Planctomycetota bacterium]
MNPPAAPHDREEGIVLFFALLALTAVLALGSLSFELSGAHVEAQMRYVDRIQALSVAGGGVAEAYQRLSEDGTFRGLFTHTAASGETARVQVVDVGADVEIRSVGKVGNAHRGLVSVASVEVTGSSAALPHAMHTLNDIAIMGSTVIWSGQAVSAGDLQLNDGGGYVGSHRRTSVNAIDIDLDALRSLADTVTEDNLYWSDRVPSGTAFTTGNVEALSGGDFAGTLIVAGNVIVKASRQDLSFHRGERNEVLVVQGNLIFEEAGTIRINGIVLVEGNVLIKKDVDQVTWDGALRCNGQIMVEHSDLTFNYVELPIDPAIFSEIQGVSLQGSNEARITALRSRPITAEETETVLKGGHR